MCLFCNASFFLQISLTTYYARFMAVVHIVMKDEMFLLHGKGIITVLI